MFSPDVVGSRHPWFAEAIVLRARIVAGRGEHDAARELLERGLALQERQLGKHHPAVGGTLVIIGNVRLQAGELEGARLALTRARDIFEAVPALHSSKLPDALFGLATLAMMTGDTEAAGDRYRRLLELETERLGPQHPSVAETLNNLGVWHLSRFEYDDALTHFERALAIAELDPRARQLARFQTLVNIAVCHRGREQWAQSAKWSREALHAGEALYGLEHPDLSYPLSSLGYALARIGRTEESIEHLEHAVRLRAEVGPIDRLAFIQFQLAQVLWVAEPGRGRDRERSVELARTAEAGYRRGEADSTAELVEVTQWLAEAEVDLAAERSAKR